MNRLAVVLAVLALSACAGGPPTDDGSSGARTIPRPAALADLPTLVLLAPGATNAGLQPTFEWTAVNGATSYRLSVLGPDLPRWAWQGTETSVRYGAVDDGQAGPELVPGSWWAVTALDANLVPIAVSDLRAVSPNADPGPEPAWADPNAPPPSQPTDAGATLEPAPGGVCGLISLDDIAAIMGGEWVVDESASDGQRSCTWAGPAGNFRIDVAAAGAFSPEAWGGERDPLVAGIGDDAFLVSSAFGPKVGFLRSEASYLISFNMARNLEAFAALARRIDEGL